MQMAIFGGGNQMAALAKHMVRPKSTQTIKLDQISAMPSMDPTPADFREIHKTVARVAPTAQISNRQPSLDDIPLTEAEKRELVLQRFRRERKPKEENVSRKKKKKRK